MLRKDDVAYFRGNHGVGQKIKCIKLYGGEKKEQVTATILGIFPQFALVTDEKKRYRWCVKWVDLMIQEGIGDI